MDLTALHEFPERGFHLGPIEESAEGFDFLFKFLAGDRLDEALGLAGRTRVELGCLSRNPLAALTA